MDETTILLATAQIAVAFAGFATLASILGREYSHDDPKVDAFRLSNMLIYSLTVAAFALYPIIPLRLGWSPSQLWPRCSVLALVWCVLIFVDVVRRIRKTWSLPGFNRFFAITNTFLSIATVAVFSANALTLMGVFPPGDAFASAAFPIYLLGLFLLLTACGGSFARIIYSLLIAGVSQGSGRR